MGRVLRITRQDGGGAGSTGGGRTDHPPRALAPICRRVRADRSVAGNAGALHGSGLLDRHRQCDVAAGAVFEPDAQCAGQGALGLRPHMLLRRLHAGHLLDGGRALTMLRYIIWRIAVMIPTLLIISALVFTIIE